MDRVGLHEEILHYTSSLPIRFLPVASLQDDLGRNWTKIVALDTRLLAVELEFGIYSLDSQDELVAGFSLPLQLKQIQIEEKEKTIELGYSYRGRPKPPVVCHRFPCRRLPLKGHQSTRASA
jgi:hypothetical protein